MQKAKGILYVGKNREPMQINGIYSRAASKQLLMYVDEDGEKLKFKPKRAEDKGIPVKTIDSRSRAKFELHKKKPILYQKIKRNIRKAKMVTEEKKKEKEKKQKKSDDKTGKAPKVTEEPAPKNPEKIVGKMNEQEQQRNPIDVINELINDGFNARKPVGKWASKYDPPKKKIKILYQDRSKGTHGNARILEGLPKNFRPIETDPPKGSRYSTNTYLKHKKKNTLDKRLL